MVNEAPKTIASFARNRLRARLLFLGLCERETLHFCWYTWPIPILTEARVLEMVNEASKTIASFAPNRLRARLMSVGLFERGTRHFCWYTWPKTYSNRSPCPENGQWSPRNDIELRSQSATRGFCPWGYVKVRTTVEAIHVRMKIVARMIFPEHVHCILPQPVASVALYLQ
jgi:hypothetical protein